MHQILEVSTYAVKSESNVTNKSGKVTTKPDIIHDYNFSMNGCDRSDQMLSYYNNFKRRTVKWWKRLFRWCIEVTQVNAFILHCLTRYEGTKPFSLKKFKDKLIHQLINEANTCIPDDHKHHVPKQPTARNVRVQGPSHLVNWLPDASAAHLKIEREPTLNASHVMHICILNNILKIFVLFENILFFSGNSTIICLSITATITFFPDFFFFFFFFFNKRTAESFAMVKTFVW